MKIACEIQVDDAWLEMLYEMLKAAGRVESRKDIRTVVEGMLHQECGEIRYLAITADTSPPFRLGTEPYWKKADEIRENQERRARGWKAVDRWLADGKTGPTPEFHLLPWT